MEFLDRPMSDDPHDQLLLQIRGAVAEYERTLIADRMRRGRLNKYRAGKLIPWTRPPYGYRVDPDHPREPALLQLDAADAAMVLQMFEEYPEPRIRYTRLRKGSAIWGSRPRPENHAGTFPACAGSSRIQPMWAELNQSHLFSPCEAPQIGYAACWARRSLGLAAGRRLDRCSSTRDRLTGNFDRVQAKLSTN